MCIRDRGRVDHQDAFLDTDAQERARGITIFSKQAELEFENTKIMLLDTPGPVSYTHLDVYKRQADTSVIPLEELYRICETARELLTGEWSCGRVKMCIRDRVIYSGWLGSYGNAVIISHGNSLYTLYAHNSSLVVSYGAKVSRGQKIARVGSTGSSTGNHSHFEVRKGGNSHGNNVSPWPYLR